MVDSRFFLSHSDPRPMYQQIVDQITAKVMAGDWLAGQELPSIRELAAESRTSVITVRRAYEELERAGLIHTRPGKGSVVAERADLASELMRQEMQGQIVALLASADRLGLSRAELMRLIKNAFESQPAGAAGPTTPTGSKP